MSTSDDLTSAFGRPARDLSQMLTRNPRRSRREEAEEAAEDHTSPQHDQQAAHSTRSDPPAAPESDGGRERHLTAAPEVPAGTSAPSPQHASHQDPTGSAREPARNTTTTPTREPTAPSRARRGATAGRPRGQARSANPVELDPSTSYQVPVYVHPGVRAAATTKRKIEKLTNAEIAFNAIDEVQHRLAGLIRDRRLQARPDSSLFPGRVRRGRLGGGGAAATAGEARRVLWGFRATGAELEIIDRLVGDSGAESRSELVAVALEETLLR